MAPVKFGALRKAKPQDQEPASLPLPAHPERAPARRMQTSVRVSPAMYRALRQLATEQYLASPDARVTVHDLIVEGIRLVLEVNGIKLPPE